MYLLRTITCIILCLPLVSIAQFQYAEITLDKNTLGRTVKVQNNDLGAQNHDAVIQWGKINTLDSNSDVFTFRQSTEVDKKTLTFIVEENSPKEISIGFKNPSRTETIFVNFHDDVYTLPNAVSASYVSTDVFEITYCSSYFIYRLNGRVIYVHKDFTPGDFYGTVHLEEATISKVYIAMNAYDEDLCQIDEFDFVKSSFKMHLDKNINYVPVLDSSAFMLFYFQKYMVADSYKYGKVKVYDKKFEPIGAYAGSEELIFEKGYGRNFVEINLSLLDLPSGIEYLLFEMSEINKKSKYYLRVKIVDQ